MGLDQYLFKINIPGDIFIGTKYKKTIKCISNELCNIAVNDIDDEFNTIDYCYFRKCFPIDHIILEYAKQYDDCNYYIDSLNMTRLLNHCVRVIRAMPMFKALTIDEIANFKDYDLVYEYLDNEQNMKAVNIYLANYACYPVETSYCDFSWDFKSFLNTIAFINHIYNTSKNDEHLGLLYVKSY
jgi:hypothetical protein